MSVRRSIDGGIMSAPRDKFGRPIVVVTGMGIVTSLGAGKTDNWAKLTAGESGIRTVTRFPIDGLKSTMAGTVDFVSRRTLLLDRPFRAARRYGDRGSARAVRHRHARAIFPGRCSLRSRRSRPNGRSDWRSAAPSASRNSTYDDLLRVSGGGQVRAISPSLHVRLGGSSSGRDLRHQGIADFAFHGLRLRRDRDPARRRGDPPRREPTPRCASRPTARSIRKPWCAFRCCRRCRPRTIRRRPRQNRSRRTATVLSWQKAPARWCWKATSPRSRAAHRSSASLPAAAN